MTRARYLFVLANMCHLTPADIDCLSVVDFWTLVTACEQVMEQQRQGA